MGRNKSENSSTPAPPPGYGGKDTEGLYNTSLTQPMSPQASGGNKKAIGSNADTRGSLRGMLSPVSAAAGTLKTVLPKTQGALSLTIEKTLNENDKVGSQSLPTIAVNPSVLPVLGVTTGNSVAVVSANDPSRVCVCEIVPYNIIKEGACRLPASIINICNTKDYSVVSTVSSPSKFSSPPRSVQQKQEVKKELVNTVCGFVNESVYIIPISQNSTPVKRLVAMCIAPKTAQSCSSSAESKLPFQQALSQLIQNSLRQRPFLLGVPVDVKVLGRVYQVIPLSLDNLEVGSFEHKFDGICTFQLSSGGILEMVPDNWECRFRIGYSLKDREQSYSGSFYNNRVISVEAADSEEKDSDSAFSGVGGLGPQISEIVEYVCTPLTCPEKYKEIGIKPPRGVLLYGPPGTGKTLLASCVAQATNARFFSLSASQLVSQYVGDAETTLRTLFRTAASCAPSVIFLDEIDSVCGDRSKATDPMQHRLVTTMLNLLDGVDALDGVIQLAATNRPNSLDPALRRPGRLDREIEVGIPTAAGRTEILKKQLCVVAHKVSSQDITQLCQNAHGYVGSDLALVVREAGLRCLLRLGQDGTDIACITKDDLTRGFAFVRPSAMQEVVQDVPNVFWSDIGGQADVKQRLQEAFEWPLLHPELFASLGIQPPRGILLYGPPGCSKTLLAKALATECSRNFLAVKGPELFSKWVGESEKAVKEVFRKARAAAPSIIFFDEIDSIAGARGKSDEVVDRVLSQLLIELDGVEQQGDVTVLAATNRPDILDAALLRPGRIDRALYVAPPDFPAIQAIFDIEFKKMAIEACSPAQLDELCQVCLDKGLSGAEVSAVCREAAMRAITLDQQSQYVPFTLVMEAARTMEARITKEMLQFYKRYRESNGLTNV